MSKIIHSSHCSNVCYKPVHVKTSADLWVDIARSPVQLHHEEQSWPENKKNQNAHKKVCLPSTRDQYVANTSQQQRVRLHDMQQSSFPPQWECDFFYEAEFVGNHGTSGATKLPFQSSNDSIKCSFKVRQLNIFLIVAMWKERRKLSLRTCIMHATLSLCILPSSNQSAFVANVHYISSRKSRSESSQFLWIEFDWLSKLET